MWGQLCFSFVSQLGFKPGQGQGQGLGQDAHSVCALDVFIRSTLVSYIIDERKWNMGTVCMGALTLGGVSPVRVPSPDPGMVRAVPGKPPAWLHREMRVRAMDAAVVATCVDHDLFLALRHMVHAVVTDTPHSDSPKQVYVPAGATPGARLARKLEQLGLRDFFKMEQKLQGMLLPAVIRDRHVCRAVFSLSTSRDFGRDVVGDGGTLLHHCAQFGTAPGFDPLTWIMARDEGAKLDTDQPDAQGRTPLMRAAAVANLRGVTVLLAARARTDLRDASKKTAVFHAVDGMPHGPQWANCYQAIGNASAPEALVMPRSMRSAIAVQAYAAAAARKHHMVGAIPVLDIAKQGNL